MPSSRTVRDHRFESFTRRRPRLVRCGRYAVCSGGKKHHEGSLYVHAALTDHSQSQFNSSISVAAMTLEPTPTVPQSRPPSTRPHIHGIPRCPPTIRIPAAFFPKTLDRPRPSRLPHTIFLHRPRTIPLDKLERSCRWRRRSELSAAIELKPRWN